MHIKTEQYDIKIINDFTYTLGSSDNLRSYSKEYILADERVVTSRHGIITRTTDDQDKTIIILAGGGASGVHERSVILLDKLLFVAVGDLLCCIELPSMELQWHSKVDTATCFGVYYSKKYRCIITHGECEISRVKLTGEVDWSVSGKDIFSESFSLFQDHVKVVDFNKEKYRIELASGQITLVGS